MPEPTQLRPFDIPVALRLIEAPGQTFTDLHTSLGISLSTAHTSVERLRKTKLLYADQRRINHTAFLEFLEHGIRYAFPAELGHLTTGVPTGYSGPILSHDFVAAQPIVWPDPKGTVVGQSLIPLFPQAHELPARCPWTYEMLTLIDAIRMGRIRERDAAMKYLRMYFAKARRMVA